MKKKFLLATKLALSDKLIYSKLTNFRIINKTDILTTILKIYIITTLRLFRILDIGKSYDISRFCK